MFLTMLWINVIVWISKDVDKCCRCWKTSRGQGCEVCERVFKCEDAVSWLAWINRVVFGDKENFDEIDANYGDQLIKYGSF
jgi:hypothetical protein